MYTEVLETPSINDEEVMDVHNKPSWMDPMLIYLKDGKLPQDKAQAQSIAYKATRYTLIDGTLYKRSFSMPYLCRLHPLEAQYAVAKVHEGICGQHLSGRALAHQVLRQGYYWPTMKADAAAYVQKCDKRQRFSPVQHQPTTPI